MYRSMLIILWIVLFSLSPFDFAVAEEDALGGASAPNTSYTRNPPSVEHVERHYKRVHQYALKRLLEDDAEESIRYLNEFLAAYPDDAESYFMLCAVLAQQGDAENALEAMRKAIDLGTPPGRFIAGPRWLFDPIREYEAFTGMTQDAGDLIHGPKIGSIQNGQARIWVRTAIPAEVVAIAYEVGADYDAIRSRPSRSTPESDFTAEVNLEGLKPDTAYLYSVEVNGESQGDYRFRTFPSKGEASSFSIAFGGGAGWVPVHEHVWDTVRSCEPLAILLLGDNVYSDDPESPDMQRYCYYRRQSREEFRRLTSSTAVYAIWDDHDFGTDDSWGGPLIETPTWKRMVWNIFKQNWVNPSSGGGESQPGVWYSFSIGDVEFFMLDGRYYREDAGRFGGEGVPNPSMLGPVQKEWLKDRLRKSDATFKVVVSPVPWDFRTKPGQAGLDTWLGYAEEREEIFSFIEENHIEGIVLLSADRHRSDAWRIERKEGYDFYEFNSSRLTNQHTHGEMEEAIFSYNRLPSFGLVTFDTTATDPTVRYEVVNIDNERVHSLTVSLSSLQFDDR